MNTFFSGLEQVLIAAVEIARLIASLVNMVRSLIRNRRDNEGQTESRQYNINQKAKERRKRVHAFAERRKRK